MAKRFECLAVGKYLGALLVLWEKDKRRQMKE